MKAFRLQFLGDNASGRSCKILNEDDIDLHYDEDAKTLYATNEQPLIIENKYLGYQIHCSITDFYIHYTVKSLNPIYIEDILLRCNVFLMDMAPNNFVIKGRRETAYYSSLNYFLKSLAFGTIKTSNHSIYNYCNQNLINPDKYFSVTDSELQKIVRIKPKTDICKYAGNMNFSSPVSGVITVADPLGNRTNIFFLTDEFTVDSFGLIDKKDSVNISGQMGNLRIGSTIPLDYEPIF